MSDTSAPSCKHCGDTLYQQGDPNDGGAEWKHETTRSIRCELFAEPADGREFETTDYTNPIRLQPCGQFHRDGEHDVRTPNVSVPVPGPRVWGNEWRGQTSAPTQGDQQ